MIEINVHVNAPELSHAVLELASAIAMSVSSDAAKFSMVHQSAPSTEPVAAQNAPATAYVAPAPYAAPQQPAAQAAPYTAPAPVAPPQVAPQQAPAAVPTAPQTYSMDQLAVAGTQLMDTGRGAELIQLLNSFGVQALTGLPKEQYGAFATQLRAMGARI